MAKSKELNNWEFRLDMAHKKFAPIERMIEKNLRYYRGDQWDFVSYPQLEDMYHDYIVENLVFSNIRAIIPRLAFRNPKYFVSAKKKPYATKGKGGEMVLFDTLGAAIHNEVLLTYYLEEMKMLRESRKCLYDALIGPMGIMRFGYTLKTEKIKKDSEIEVNELIKADSPFAMRYAPSDFRFDTEAIDSHLNDARWCSFRWVKPLEDVKANTRYSNVRNLKPNFTVDTTYGNGNDYKLNMDSDTEDLLKMVEGWTIYDKKDRQVYTLVPTHDKFLEKRDWEKSLQNIEGLPVETLYFNENPDDVFPVSDVDMYRPLQDNLNRLLSLNLSHVKSVSQRRYLVGEDSMDQEEMRKLTYGGDGTVAMVKGANPGDKVVPLKDATISQDIYAQVSNLRSAIRQMGGVSQAEALAFGNSETATEPALIERAAATIRGDQQDRYEDFMVRGGRKVFMILQTTLDKTSIPLDQQQFELLQQRTPTKLEKITGNDGAVILQPWLNLSKSDIQGEYDFSIEVGSTQPINAETRKRDFVQMAGMSQGNPYIKTREMTRLGLETFDVKDPDSLMKSEEEVQQEAQAAAQAATQAELQERQMKDQTDLQKTTMKSKVTHDGNVMKAQTDMAKVVVEAKKNADKDNIEKASLLSDMLRGN
jgi:hypothetical protein